MGILAELKRRKVVRVAAGYVVLAWVVIQAADVIFPALRLPDWTISFVTMLAMLGFPLAVFFAWAYELTPDGLKRDAGAAQPEPVTGGNHESTGAASKTSADGRPSIAVLPFVNMSADPEQEYFGDGIAEEILNGLAQVRDLKVAARTSSFYFKGEKIDLKSIGETLGVDHVLEGSVRKSGDRLRITAQLIRIDEGFHLWSEIYDRDSADIFAVQEEIARSVVDNLQLELGLGKDEKIVEQGTDNAEAYSWYLRGRFFVEQQSPDNFPKAIESYRKVTELDPAFAGGYGGLAYALSYNTTWFAAFDDDIAGEIREACRRALELDPDQTDALLARAMELMVIDSDYVSADALVRKALTQGGNQVLVVDFVWYAFLMPQKRYVEARQILEVLERHEPLSSLVKQGIASQEMMLGNNDAAIRHFRQALELNPADFFSYLFMADIFMTMGKFDEADRAIQAIENIVGEDFFFTRNVRSRWHCAQGDVAAATADLEESIALYEASDGQVPWATWIGYNYIWLGRIDEGIDWLERASDKPEFFATVQHFFAHRTPEIYDNPRFQALLRKRHLDDASIEQVKALGPL